MTQRPAGVASFNDGATYRGFARHIPSGERYILEYDQGYNTIIGVIGPIHHTEVVAENLEYANMDDGRDDAAWANAQAWQALEFDGTPL